MVRAFWLSVIILFQSVHAHAQESAAPAPLRGEWYPSRMSCSKARSLGLAVGVNSQGLLEASNGAYACMLSNWKAYNPKARGEDAVGDWSFKISCRAKLSAPSDWPDMKIGSAVLFKKSSQMRMDLHLEDRESSAFFYPPPKKSKRLQLKKCD